jgi:diguanylate cyclase (GGDEF)-like protein
LAAVIFINEFRMGLILSVTFLLFLSGLMALIPHKFALPFNSTHRFSLSLVTMSAVCHVSSYYYTKAVGYIQRLYQEGIEDLAYRDQLTGLANRWSFERWAIEKLNTVNPNNSVTALVFLDIDNFKTINDSFGHDVGDSVLQHFAQRLKNNVRNKDRSTHKHDYSIARFAGDEFVLMLYDVRSKQDLDGILQRISGLFENENLTNNQVGKLTLSIGVAMYPTDAKDLAELTRCADKAMYFAKHSGKNRFAYYQDDLTTPLIEDMKCFEPCKSVETIPSNVTALHQQSS